MILSGKIQNLNFQARELVNFHAKKVIENILFLANSIHERENSNILVNFSINIKRIFRQFEFLDTVVICTHLKFEDINKSGGGSGLAVKFFSFSSSISSAKLLLLRLVMIGESYLC